MNTVTFLGIAIHVTFTLVESHVGFGIQKDMFGVQQSNISRDARKPVFGVSDQVGDKLVCAVTDKSENLEILDICRRGLVLSV